MTTVTTQFIAYSALKEIAKTLFVRRMWHILSYKLKFFGYFDVQNNFCVQAGTFFGHTRMYTCQLFPLLACLENEATRACM